MGGGAFWYACQRVGKGERAGTFVCASAVFCREWVRGGGEGCRRISTLGSGAFGMDASVAEKASVRNIFYFALPL